MSIRWPPVMIVTSGPNITSSPMRICARVHKKRAPGPIATFEPTSTFRQVMVEPLPMRTCRPASPSIATLHGSTKTLYPPPSPQIHCAKRESQEALDQNHSLPMNSSSPTRCTPEHNIAAPNRYIKESPNHLGCANYAHIQTCSHTFQPNQIQNATAFK